MSESSAEEVGGSLVSSCASCATVINIMAKMTAGDAAADEPDRHLDPVAQCVQLVSKVYNHDSLIDQTVA
jgi:hypothetical protein